MRATTVWAAGLLGLAIAVMVCGSTGCCGLNWDVFPPQELDADGDGVCDKDDVCPGFDDKLDADGDGVPDGCDICRGDDASGDTDGDGVCDDTDPCPSDNPDDTDGDGVCDSDDLCPGFDDAVDADGDGRPDGCDVLVSVTGYGEVEEKSCGLLTPFPANDRWEISGWVVDGVFQEAGPGDGAIKPAAPAVVAAVFRFAWADGVEPLDLWLEANPTVADALVWEGDLLDPLPDRCGQRSDFPSCGELHSWPWPGEMQDSLFRAFEKAVLGQPSGVSDTPPNAADTSDGDRFTSQQYFPEDAKGAFMAYAANSLAVEIGRLVPWSLLDTEMYGSDELAVLFDSRKFFFRRPDGNYKVSNVPHGGMSTMSAPETALAFLRGGDLPYTDMHPYFCRDHTLDDCDGVILSDTTAETIANTIHWFRLNAIHFMGHWWNGNAEAHWQYRGYTPAVRLMTGTQRTEYLSEERNDTRPDGRIIPRTAGCWGTTGFMRTVLRAVNIPVVLETAGGHALPSFPSEARMGRPSHMSHGDDPYSMLVKTGEWPSYDLLMMKDDWEAWFRPPPAPGEPEPELVDPTDEEIEDGFLDSLPPDIDYCGGDPDCGYAPPPEPELEAIPGEPIENTPKMWVGGRARALTLSWTCWYTAKKHCEGGQVPVEGSEIALRNWSMADLMSLDCSTFPLTGREGLPGEIQFCHGDFFEYLDDMIAGVGGCEAVGPGAGKHYYTYEVCTPMPQPPGSEE